MMDKFRNIFKNGKKVIEECVCVCVKYLITIEWQKVQTLRKYHVDNSFNMKIFEVYQRCEEEKILSNS